MKYFKLTTLILACLTLSVTAIADSPAGDDSAAALNAIKNNTAQMHEDLKGLGIAAANRQSHQYQAKLGDLYTINSSVLDALEQNQTLTNAATQADVTKNLSQMSNQPQENPLISASNIAALPASDTLIASPFSSSFSSFWHSTTPQDTSNDSAFNFGNIIDSTHFSNGNPKEVPNKKTCDDLHGSFVANYSDDDSSGICTFSKQYQQAKNYMTYLTDNYEPIVSGLNLNKLNNNKDYIKQLNDNSDYINFKNHTRSMIAAQSLSLDNYNHILQERMEQPGLGSKLNMVDLNDPSQPKIANASTLQAEQYAIDSKLKNPAWYKQLATESATAVQKQQLIALLNIQRQLEQQHIDNERMIATQSAIALNLTTMQKMLLKSGDVKLVNDAIDKITESKS